MVTIEKHGIKVYNSLCFGLVFGRFMFHVSMRMVVILTEILTCFWS